MLDVPTLVQWLVVVELVANGKMVPLVASEELCRKMAREVTPGELVIGTIGGQDFQVLFQKCVRAENGVVKEVLDGRED